MNPAPAFETYTPARPLFNPGVGDALPQPLASPRIVAVGGGTGLPAVLEGLCSHAADSGTIGTDSVTAIVTVTDDGGSSGRLRR